LVPSSASSAPACGLQYIPSRILGPQSCSQNHDGSCFPLRTATAGDDHPAAPRRPDQGIAAGRLGASRYLSARDPRTMLHPPSRTVKPGKPPVPRLSPRLTSYPSYPQIIHRLARSVAKRPPPGWLSFHRETGTAHKLMVMAQDQRITDPTHASRPSAGRPPHVAALVLDATTGSGHCRASASATPSAPHLLVAEVEQHRSAVQRPVMQRPEEQCRRPGQACPTRQRSSARSLQLFPYPPQPDCLFRSSDPFNQALVIVLDVADASADGPAGKGAHPLRGRIRKPVSLRRRALPRYRESWRTGGARQQAARRHRE